MPPLLVPFHRILSELSLRARSAQVCGATAISFEGGVPAKPKLFSVSTMPEPISHFTNVVRAGRLVFVSGCVASDGQGRTVGGNDATPFASPVGAAHRCSSPIGMSSSACAGVRSTAR